MDANSWLWVALIAFLVFCCLPMLFMWRHKGHGSNGDSSRSLPPAGPSQREHRGSDRRPSLSRRTSDSLLLRPRVSASGSVTLGRGWFHRWSGSRIALNVASGVLIGAAVEWWGSGLDDATRGRFTGDAWVGLGLVPVIQMPILAPLTLWSTTRWFEWRSERSMDRTDD